VEEDRGESEMRVICILALFLIIGGCLGIETDETSFVPSNPAIPCTSSTGDYKELLETEYLFLVPKILFSGGEGAVTMVAFRDGRPAERCISFSLIDENGKEKKLVQASTGGRGHAVASFEVPDIDPGSYTLAARVVGTNLTFTGPIQVQKGAVIFLETDRPIYKPSQIIHGRVLSLNNQLKPIEQEVLVEITDAKGIKVFKKKLETNAFGVASFDLPLASELNLGTWKITAESDDAKTTVDVRVERYVLPKFEIEVSTPKDWFLVDEEITGSVSARYFFGKPVEGVVEIEAFRYVGVWEEYATFSSELKDGAIDFVLPNVRYVAGTYGAGGQGTVILNISVTDTSGHVERTSKLLKITQYPMVLQLISESTTIKPGLPFQVLVVTEDPDGKPLEKEVTITATYRDKEYKITTKEEKVKTKRGIALVELRAPKDVVGAQIVATVDGRIRSEVSLQAAYSPSASFIHLVQLSEGKPKVGEKVVFEVYSTRRGTVYYDIFANGRTVYSGASDRRRISFEVTPQMSPKAKLVAYMINPNGEVSVDSIPFDVEMELPVELKASFSKGEVEPGGEVRVDFDAGALAVIGVSIVDESVYALHEGRLNLKQVFDELERRFMEPKAEAHPLKQVWEGDYVRGAYDIIEDTGMQVLASPTLKIPRGKRLERVFKGRGLIDFLGVAVKEEMPVATRPPTTPVPSPQGEQLAKVERVRQFFPETWIWIPDLTTNGQGRAILNLRAPDTITTWRLHAVASSAEGIGISEAELKVFQDFFIEPDLPYAVTRGEEFPVRVQVYNYLNESQKVFVELKEGDWFEIVGEGKAQVSVNANSVSSVSFTIRPTKIGTKVIEVVGRSEKRADAVRKELLVEAEGSPREIVENGILKANEEEELNLSLPEGIVPDSGKVMLSITPSLVAQTISGVEDLLNMPYGCGEQNMIFFAPDVEILRYLKATGQLNPEIRAKAEMFITTGYQRELTFQRNDGSFSAFGQRDKEGSLWLTSFVLSTFSGARDVTTIDEEVLAKAARWIEKRQNTDGSWDHVGFLHHKDMMGGLSGKYALTAYVALALHDYGYASKNVVSRAQRYLEGNLDAAKDDPYALAIGALALERLGSPIADEALDALMALVKEDVNGIYWGYETSQHKSKNVEITSYAALALIEAGDPRANAAIKWIASQRNSRGGFASTQDTVMAFKALMTAAASERRDINARISIVVDGRKIKELEVTSENFDVLQTVELPQGAERAVLSLSGRGEVTYQLVRKFNVILPDIPVIRDIQLHVTYDATQVAVDDIVNVTTGVRYVGEAASTGMLIIDIAVPTGFTPVLSSIDSLREKDIISRYEIAGRKIIIYVDDLPRGEELSFTIQVRAIFPVRAVIPDSRAYSYYNPEISAESRGGSMVVV
jgi:CD109 antigen